MRFPYVNYTPVYNHGCVFSIIFIWNHHLSDLTRIFCFMTVIHLYQSVADCEIPPFNSTSPGFKITDTSDQPIKGSLKNHFGASFRVQCLSGYYFSQEEFNECSKFQHFCYYSTLWFEGLHPKPKSCLVKATEMYVRSVTNHKISVK